jgi:hypothetical protein
MKVVSAEPPVSTLEELVYVSVRTGGFEDAKNSCARPFLLASDPQDLSFDASFQDLKGEYRKGGQSIASRTGHDERQVVRYIQRYIVECWKVFNARRMPSISVPMAWKNPFHDVSFRAPSIDPHAITSIIPPPTCRLQSMPSP